MPDPLSPPQEALLRASAQPGGAILAGPTLRASQRLLRLGYVVKRSLPHNVTAVDITARGREHLARLDGGH
jgi:hypothetical protein